MKYDAFISYAWAAEDQLPVAAMVQDALHRLAKPWYKMRALQVFRDVRKAGAHGILREQLHSALDSSKFLILIACPESAASADVNDEVNHWCGKHKNIDRLLIVLTKGDIPRLPTDHDVLDWDHTTALPRSLRRFLASRPHYVDLKWVTAPSQMTLDNSRFFDNVADLAQQLHNRDKDEFVGEEVRQYRKKRRFWVAAALCFFAVAVVAVVFATLFDHQRRRAHRYADHLYQALVANYEAFVRQSKFIGMSRDALTGLQEVQSELTNLHRQYPDDKRLTDTLAELKFHLGTIQKTLGQWDAADESLRAAQSAFHDLGKAREEAVALVTRGQVARRRGDIDKAEELLQNGKAELQKLDRQDAAVRRNLALAIDELAGIRFVQGDLTKAVDETKAAWEILHPANEPEKRAIDRADAVIGHNIAIRYWRTKRLAEAEDVFRDVLRARRASVPLLVGRVEAQMDLATTLMEFGKMLRDAQKYGEARTHLKEALERWHLLDALEPWVPEYQHHIYDCHHALGRLLQSERKWDEAIKEYKSANAIIERLKEPDPTNVAFALDIGINLNAIAWNLHRLGKSEEALEFNSKGLRLVDQAQRARPKEAKYRDAVSNGLSDREKILSKLGRKPADDDLTKEIGEAMDKRGR